MQRVPKLCKQKSKFGDRAYVRIDGVKHYCGQWGTKEAKENYALLISGGIVTKKAPVPPVQPVPPVPPKAETQKVVTVNDLVALFLEHAESYYVKNG